MKLGKRQFCSWSFGNPMSLRFYPEGDEIKDDVVDDVINDGDKNLQSDEAKESQRKAEHLAAMEAANARKAREKAETLQAELETQKQQNTELNERLTRLEGEARRADIDFDLDETEFEGTDLKLVQAIKSLKSAISSRDEKITNLEKTRDDLLSERRKNDAERQRNQTYEELLSDLDEEYGAQHRNEAVQSFQKLIADGKVPQGNPARAARMLEKCYKDVAKAKTKDTKNKDDLSLDSGSGGATPPGLGSTKFKPGTLEEVAAQARALAKS